MYKKAFKIILLLFLSITSVSADEIIFNNPDFSDISGDSQDGGLSTQSIYGDLESGVRFCEYLGYDFINYVPGISTVTYGENTARYDGFSWGWVWTTDLMTGITCDDNSSVLDSGTGSTTGAYDLLIYNELISIKNELTVNSNRMVFLLEFYIFGVALTLFFTVVFASYSLFNRMSFRFNLKKK